MRRHDKAGGTPVKTRRRKMLRRRNTAKVARRRKSSTADTTDRIALLTLERDEALEQQRATSEVLKVISSSPGELEPVFKAILQSALRICEAEFGMLMLYNSGDGSFDTRVMVGAPPALVDALLHQSFRPPPGNPLDRMLRTKKTVHVIDAAAETAKPLSAQLAGARSHISLPMVKQNEVVGSISIYRTKVRPFTDKQIELVTNFAAQAVIAIENTRLLHELRESLQQQTVTADVLKTISRSASSLQTVLDTLVESAVVLAGANTGAIFQRSDDLFQATTLYGYTPEMLDYLREHPIPLGQGNVGRVALAGKTVHIPDVLAEQEHKPFGDYQRLFRIRAWLGVPILREGKIEGVFGLIRHAPEPFTQGQIELVTTFADQAMIAIENARLFEQVQERTEELSLSLDNLRAAQDRLIQTEKLASLGQLTAGIAHEIKNPLNFVNNFSGLSAELVDELAEGLKAVALDDNQRAEFGELMETLRGNLQKVVHHGKRADAIIKNMLLHSRQGSGEHRLVAINALVEESLNLAYHGARAEKQGFEIILERSFDPTAGEVDLFPQEITRVLLNLISNGFYAATKRKAEAKGGECAPTLAAATKNLGNSVEIRIRDNGAGISPEVKEKIFNPFFTTKPAGEGTGLGLSISHDIIVKQHGGSIEVDTQPGEFTEFRIVLPRGAATIAKSGERASH